MKLEDLSSFVRFEIWDFENSNAYLTAWNNESSRRERLSFDIKSDKLINSFPIGRRTPEASSDLDKEKAFSMLLANIFPAD